MLKVTEKALRESIAHHERFASGAARKGENLDSGSCALCGRFADTGSESCVRPTGEKCPVYDATGLKNCKGTPYYKEDSREGKVDSALLYGPNRGKILNDRWFRYWAKKEAEFLKSLLP